MDRFDARSIAVSIAAPLAAAIGCLQPGIDPVFLTLLTKACHIPLTAHGLVVGTTQGGAALGALTVWRLGAALPRLAVIAAAAFAVLCSLPTPLASGLAPLLTLRLGYGMAMGVVYARAMSAYAAGHPNKAYGAVYLVQLLISTLVSGVLPEAEPGMGARAALALLALAPATALMALLLTNPPGKAASETDRIRAPVPPAGWALAAATFWFICATMLVWSFTAALATSAGISDRTIGHAVAIGSVVGAVTALSVMRERLVVPLTLTALLSGLALAAPLAMIAPDRDGLFIASVILLNIGSTAIIIRCSGLATATSTDSRFRTFVACTHPLGTIAGPLLGSAITGQFGLGGLPYGVTFALAAGMGAVIFAALSPAHHPFRTSDDEPPSQARMALD